MKKLPSLKKQFSIIIAIAVFPFIAFSQDSFIKDDFGSGKTNVGGKEINVSSVKKMTRYSLEFVVDLPTIQDVLKYVTDELGILILDVDQLNDPNWNPSTWATRNCEFVQNEDGEYRVQVRFYPPVDPMSVEDVSGIKRNSRLLCSEIIEQLKASQIK